MMSSTKQIDTDDARIEVVLQGGDGPLAVMVPAGGRGVADFEALAALLAKSGWRTAAINPRGAGASEGPSEGITLHTLAADVGGVIESLNGAPAAVIGHAFGNRVARCLAADKPDLVRCVVLLAAGGKAPAAPEVMQAMAALGKRMPREERRAALKTAFFAETSDATAWLKGNWAKAIAAQRVAGDNTPVDAWWGGGEAPILAVQGKEDRCAPPGNGYLLKEEFGPRITVCDVEGAAHALLPEQPDRVAELVVDYLNHYR